MRPLVSANPFSVCKPLAAKRQIHKRAQRTCVDFVRVIPHILDMEYLAVQQVLLVLDNLNTHSAASLCHGFAPEEANRLNARLKVHATPRHRSWLNMAEIERSVLDYSALIQHESQNHRQPGA